MWIGGGESRKKNKRKQQVSKTLQWLSFPFPLIQWWTCWKDPFMLFFSATEVWQGVSRMYYGCWGNACIALTRWMRFSLVNNGVKTAFFWHNFLKHPFFKHSQLFFLANLSFVKYRNIDFCLHAGFEGPAGLILFFFPIWHHYTGLANKCDLSCADLKKFSLFDKVNPSFSLGSCNVLQLVFTLRPFKHSLPPLHLPVSPGNWPTEPTQLWQDVDFSYIYSIM